MKEDEVAPTILPVMGHHQHSQQQQQHHHHHQISRKSPGMEHSTVPHCPDPEGLLYPADGAGQGVVPQHSGSNAQQQFVPVQQLKEVEGK